VVEILRKTGKATLAQAVLAAAPEMVLAAAAELAAALTVRQQYQDHQYHNGPATRDNYKPFSPNLRDQSTADRSITYRWHQAVSTWQR